MQKQIQRKSSLTLKILMLTLGTFGGTVLHADWHSLSSGDKVNWLVNHGEERGEELTRDEINQAVRSLSWEDREKFSLLLIDRINNAVEAGGFSGLSDDDVRDLMKKLDSLRGTDQAHYIHSRMSKKAKEVMLVKSFELDPLRYPMPVEIWWQFSPLGQQKCFRHFSRSDQRRIQSKILAGDLAFKIRYFGYLDLKDQRRIWKEELLRPAAKALCFKHFSAGEQMRIWMEEFTGNPILKAVCAGWLKEPLLQLFWDELDKYTKERLR